MFKSLLKNKNKFNLISSTVSSKIALKTTQIEVKFHIFSLLNKFYMLFNSKRHFFCHWTFPFSLSLTRSLMARDYNCPRVVLLLIARDREEMKIMNARKNIYNITCKSSVWALISWSATTCWPLQLTYEVQVIH